MTAVVELLEGNLPQNTDLNKMDVWEGVCWWEAPFTCLFSLSCGLGEF